MCGVKKERGRAQEKLCSKCFLLDGYFPFAACGAIAPRLPAYLEYTCTEQTLSIPRVDTYSIYAVSIYARSIYKVYICLAYRPHRLSNSTHPALCVGVSRPLQGTGHWGMWGMGSHPYHSLIHLPIIYPPPVRAVIILDESYFQRILFPGNDSRRGTGPFEVG